MTEALNECCSGTPTPTVEYRWVEMTGASDFVCSGYDKYAKEKKQQSTDSGAKFARAKIYEVKVEDRQGNLLAHGIPCVRTSDNKCGFYNLARNEFEYDASGNLTLTAGPNVN